MIEVSLKLLNKMTNSAISKLLEKIVKDKAGLTTNIDIEDFKVSNDDTDVVVHVNTTVKLSQKELLDLIFKKG